MGQSNAERQRRWRERREALVKANPEMAERELMQAAEECEQLSDAERIALADKLADMANRHLWRAHELAQLAMKVRVPG
jgi:adenine C2-methylase RlmN of 23S rRNA A2503 and tRNA A37